MAPSMGTAPSADSNGLAGAFLGLDLGAKDGGLGRLGSHAADAGIGGSFGHAAAAGPPPGLGAPHPANLLAPPPNLFSPASYDADKWVYKDPQGVVQGPFTQADIREWQSQGYFTLVSVET